MANLSVDGDDLIQALQSGGTDGAEFYLDTETGAVVMIYDGMIDGVSIEDDEDMDEIVASRPYLQIVPIRSYEAFEILKDFAETVRDADVKSRLEDALVGKKVFRRFKDCLYDYPDIQRDFTNYEEAAYRKIALEWIESNEIDAVVRFGLA